MVLTIMVGLLVGLGAQVMVLLSPGAGFRDDTGITEVRASGTPPSLQQPGPLARYSALPAGSAGTLEPVSSTGPKLLRGPEPAPVAARKTQAASGELVNVLVLGVDARPGALGQYMGTRSDTMMIVQVTPGTGRIELLSIPRDLLVEVAPGVQDRINTAYAYGGVEQARAVVEGFTGIPIHHYAIVDFKGFEAVVNAMGGVQVEVQGEQFPPHWHMGDGLQTLDGHRALLYARYRGTAGGDLDRIERQQQLVAALRSKALRWNTLTKLPEILGILMRNVDTDVGPGEAISLARVLVSRGSEGGIEAAQLKGLPTTMPNGDQVLIPDYAANETVLQEFRQ